MTEQQANTLMERIGTLTKFMEWQKEVGFSPSFEGELELAALTALCRHRDFAVYYSICPYMMLQEGALLDKFIGMQVWQPGFEP